jgi:transcriptional antiterminator NusG
MQCRLTSANSNGRGHRSGAVGSGERDLYELGGGKRFRKTESQTEGGEALAVSGAAANEFSAEASGAIGAPRSESAFRGAGAPGSKNWYAVWTQSHFEQAVSQQLSAKGFTAFLPEMSVWSKRGGEQHLIRVPMFPGYLFVRDEMDKHSYIEILRARGVVRILEDGWTRLTPVPDAEIDAIQQVVSAEVPVFAHEHLAHGDRVEVTEGPLTGLEGWFVQDKPTKGRLVLNVDLLGRSVAVEVDCTAVRLKK